MDGPLVLSGLLTVTDPLQIYGFLLLFDSLLYSGLLSKDGPLAIFGLLMCFGSLSLSGILSHYDKYRRDFRLSDFI